MPKRKSKSEDNGDDNGRGKHARNGVLDFFDFIDAVGPRLAELSNDARLSYYDGDGKPFGDPAGKIALEPLDTLEERLRAFLEGPCAVAIRTRDLSGHYSIVGKFRVLARPGTGASAAAPESGLRDLVALLMRQNDELRADFKAALVERSSSPAKAAQEVDSFSKLAATVKDLIGPRDAAPASATKEKSLVEQMADVRAFKTLAGELFPTSGDNSLALKALDSFSPGLNDLLRATGALVVAKVEQVASGSADAKRGEGKKE